MALPNFWRFRILTIVVVKLKTLWEPIKILIRKESILNHQKLGEPSSSPTYFYHIVDDEKGLYALYKRIRLLLRGHDLG